MRSSRVWCARAVERAIVAAAALANLGAQPSGGWSVFAPPDGSFTVEMPGPPVLERRERLTPVGYVHEVKYWLRSGDARLAVEMHDIPAIASALFSDVAIIDRACKGVLESERGTALDARALVMHGAPARDFTYRLPGEAGLAERVLAVLVGSRLYLITGMAAQPTSHPDVARFFASFRFWSEGERAGAGPR